MKFEKKATLTASILAIAIGGGSLLMGQVLNSSLEALDNRLAPKPISFKQVTKSLPKTETTPASAPKPATTHSVESTTTQKPVAKENIAPERSSGRITKPVITSKDYMIIAAHPAASYAGAKILENGGHAIDAALAAQAMLNLVEPQSSGIGGGGFMMYWDKEQAKVTAYDGRETAPLTVDPKFFFYPDGSKKEFMEAVIGGASVGVPGLLKMFELARRDMRNLGYEPATLEDIFADTIALSESGFPVSPRLHTLLSNEKHLSPNMKAYDYFIGEDGEIPAIGDILENPEFAESLTFLAENGLNSFYTGDFAEEIALAVENASGQPGSLTAQDLADYEALKRPLKCTYYLSDYRVCGMPPPSSGGIAVAQILGILEATDFNNKEPASAESIQLFAEAMKLTFADRAKYLGDSDFVHVPVDGMLNAAYLNARALDMDMSSNPKEKASAGNPVEGQASLYGPDNAIELPSTTHIVVVDKYGNAVSLTSSIETAFGSRQMVGGFLLNNQLTDFSSNAFKDGLPVANRIEAGKRPRSSMSPTIVLDKDNNIKALTGSPGGSRIIGYTAQSLVAMLNWDMSAQEAADMPHFQHRNWKMELEEGQFTPEMVEAMKAQGYDVVSRKMTSGLHIIERLDNGNYRSGTDPRREGYPVSSDNLPKSLTDSFAPLFQ